MRLKFFSQASLKELKNGIYGNIDAYTSGNLTELLGSLPATAVCESRLEAPGDVPELDGASEKDGENAIKLYRWLAKLNKVEAADPRLWAWLTHGPFSSYTAKRWDIKAADNPENSVLSRYFIPGKSLEAFSRNALARLWWGARQTVNESDKEDPFELTKVLFSSQQLHQGLMERTIGRSEHILKASLRTWQKWTEEYGSPDSTDDVLKDWTKKLTVAGSVALLDACGKDQLEYIAKNSLKLAVNNFAKSEAETVGS